MGNVVVTGATGFIGSALVARLSAEGLTGKRALRRPARQSVPGWSDVVVGEMNSEADWDAALAGASTVVHLAAMVHVTRASDANQLEAFCEINERGSERLARRAAAAGVRRLVYLSSVKVNGEATRDSHPFCEADIPHPAGAYGVSKWRAEQALARVAAETGLEVVIVRPPLVYGPGVKANFLTVMRWLERGIPLPLGRITNRRSLVALDNLVDFIVVCLEHPRAANQTFLVSDDEDLSTPMLLERLGRALRKPARLFAFPVRLLEAGATLVGRRAWLQRLCGSLQVDIEKARTVLDWHPPVSVDHALAETARHLLEMGS